MKQTATEYWKARRERDNARKALLTSLPKQQPQPVRIVKDIYGINGGDRDHS